MAFKRLEKEEKRGIIHNERGERNGKIYTRTDKSLDVVVNWRHEKEKELYGEFAYKYYKEVK